jgi:hypothetical protein
MTQGQYQEIVASRDWCRDNGMPGLERYYREELSFQASRYALPPGSIEYRELDDERPRRRRD